MKTPGSIQYTLRQVPEALDAALRARSKQDRKSLNQTALDLLSEGLHLRGDRLRHRDLDFMFGSWVEDAAFDAAVDAQHQIDAELWK
jgi:hypothetical protein